jgi:hypothetical protein
MIRKAEAKDVSSIVDLGLEFGLATQKIHTMKVNSEKIRETVHIALSNSNFVLLVQEVDNVIEGVVFGMVVVSFFTNDVALQELALYSRKPSGLVRLIDAFESEAKLRGIKKIVLGCKPDFFDMTVIFKLRDYKLLETQFIKEI